MTSLEKILRLVAEADSLKLYRLAIEWPSLAAILGDAWAEEYPGKSVPEPLRIARQVISRET